MRDQLRTFIEVLLFIALAWSLFEKPKPKPEKHNQVAEFEIVKKDTSYHKDLGYFIYTLRTGEMFYNFITIKDNADYLVGYDKYILIPAK